MPMEMLVPPGYTSFNSMKNFFKMRTTIASGQAATADGLIASGTAIIGSPKTVRAKIEEVRDRTGLGILVPMLQFGVLPDDLARRSMEMFASEVMPHLRD